VGSDKRIEEYIKKMHPLPILVLLRLLDLDKGFTCP